MKRWISGILATGFLAIGLFGATAWTLAEETKDIQDTKEAEKAKASDDTKYVLISKRKDGSIDRVNKQIDIAGKLIVRMDPVTGESVSTPGGDEKAQQAKAENAPKTDRIREERISMKISGKQEYEEVLIQSGNLLQGELAQSTHGAWYFLSDETTIQVGETTEKPTLNREQPLVAVDIREAVVNLFRPEGLLTREEKDLIDLQANTLLLDYLLPGRSDIQIGDSWKPSPDVMAVLLQLDLVFQMDIRTKLAEVKKNIAILEIQGWMEGSSDGTSSKIDVDGKLYFDLNQGRIVWFGMIIREKRAAGYVNPGMEVVARLQYRIQPQAEAKHLSAEVLAGVSFDPTRYAQLLFVDPGKKWECVMDSHWYATTWSEKQATFRLVKGGSLIAQCTIAEPLDISTTQKTTLDDFTAHVQKTLGANFGKVLDQDAQRRDDGTEIYRVEVSGTVEDLAIRWIYYLIIKRGETPRQETAVFTVEEKLLKEFGVSDRQMVETFQWQ